MYTVSTSYTGCKVFHIGAVTSALVRIIVTSSTTKYKMLLRIFRKSTTSVFRPLISLSHNVIRQYVTIYADCSAQGPLCLIQVL